MGREYLMSRAKFPARPMAEASPESFRHAVLIHARRYGRHPATKHLPVQYRLDLARALVWAGWQYAENRGLGQMPWTYEEASRA
jgi:hypothetical protein